MNLKTSMLNEKGQTQNTTYDTLPIIQIGGNHYCERSQTSGLLKWRQRGRTKIGAGKNFRGDGNILNIDLDYGDTTSDNSYPNSTDVVFKMHILNYNKVIFLKHHSLGGYLARLSASVKYTLPSPPWCLYLLESKSQRDLQSRVESKLWQIRLLNF